MQTTLFYYTGTGNSLWVAKTLAKELGETDVISMVDWIKEKKPIDSKVIGLIFPVYMWGVPRRIVKFVNELTIMKPGYLFALAVNGGEVSNTLVQLKKILHRNNCELCSGFEISMPSNYIPWGGAWPKERVRQLNDSARVKIGKIAACINAKKKMPPEKGPLWQRIIYTLIYKASFKYVSKMDKKFWVDEKCNSCGICVKICPAENIVLREGKPSWNTTCEQCLACIQWCPQESIQYGKKTPAYERYHHPDIVLKEVLKIKN